MCTCKSENWLILLCTELNFYNWLLLRMSQAIEEHYESKLICCWGHHNFSLQHSIKDTNSAAIYTQGTWEVITWKSFVNGWALWINTNSQKVPTKMHSQDKSETWNKGLLDTRSHGLSGDFFYCPLNPHCPACATSLCVAFPWMPAALPLQTV